MARRLVFYKRAVDKVVPYKHEKGNNKMEKNLDAQIFGFDKYH